MTPVTEGSVSGIVRIDTGGVAVNALVFTQPATSSVFTDATGSYSISNVKPGTYTMKVVKLGYDTGSVSIQVVAGKVTNSDVVLTARAANKAPMAPSHPMPDSASTFASDTTLLRWTCTDPENDDILYDVTMALGHNPSSSDIIARNLSVPVFAKGGMSAGQTWFWQVTAHDVHGSITVGPVWNFTVVDNVCVHFDGKKQYGTVSDAIDLNLSGDDYTIEMWVKSDIGKSSWQVLLSKDNTNTQTDYLLQADDSGAFLFQSRNFNNALYSTTKFKSDTWYHLAAVQSIADGKLRFYINGVLERETSIAGSPITTSNPLRIATRINSASGNSPASGFVGYIDDICIWKTVRSIDEIKMDQYTRPAKDAAGLVAFWPFDEGTGSSTKDKSTHNHQMSLIDGVSWSIHTK